jgi:O-acetyl-ADP-ribose deacetylase (regulator of RNase III)
MAQKRKAGPRLNVECTEEVHSMAAENAKKRGFGSYAAYIVHLVQMDHQRIREEEQEKASR